MTYIYDAIAGTKAAGVFTRGQHFVSRLDGELSDVFAAIRTAFQSIAERGGHTVAHVTLSANSPSSRSSEK
jgi:energy-coupling factor transport system substrate-specific component